MSNSFVNDTNAEKCVEHVVPRQRQKRQRRVECELRGRGTATLLRFHQAAVVLLGDEISGEISLVRPSGVADHLSKDDPDALFEFGLDMFDTRSRGAVETPHMINDVTGL